jgi:hypothetical protein
VILHVERRAASVEKQEALGVALFGCDVDHRAAVRIDRLRIGATLLCVCVCVCVCGVCRVCACVCVVWVRSPPLRLGKRKE